MPRKKKKIEPESVEIEPQIPQSQGDIDENSVPIEPEEIVDVEKVKLQIYKDCVDKLIDESPEVLAVRDNAMIYGEFRYALKRIKGSFTKT